MTAANSLKNTENLNIWNICSRWTMASTISTQSSTIRIYWTHPIHPEPPSRNARAAAHAQYQQTTLWLPLRRGPKQYTGNRICSACVHSQCVWQRHIGIRHGIEYMVHFHISNAQKWGLPRVESAGESSVSHWLFVPALSAHWFDPNTRASHSLVKQWTERPEKTTIREYTIPHFEGFITCNLWAVNFK